MTNWFDSILGVALHEAEEGVISTILPTRYYDVVVEVGPGRVSAFSGIQSERRVRVQREQPNITITELAELETKLKLKNIAVTTE